MNNSDDNGQDAVFRGVHYGTLNTLPPLIEQLPNGFALHENKTIAFNGKSINLEPQLAEFAIQIMSKPIGQYTTREQLYESLDEDYFNRTDDPKKIEKRIDDIMYKLRKSFIASTGINHKFFVNKPKIGFKFDPHF